MNQTDIDWSALSPEEAKRLSRGISFDMSPTAIQERLQICASISALCIAFSHAKIIGPVNEDREADSRADTDNENTSHAH